MNSAQPRPTVIPLADVDKAAKTEDARRVLQLVANNGGWVSYKALMIQMDKWGYTWLESVLITSALTPRYIRVEDGESYDRFDASKWHITDAGRNLLENVPTQGESDDDSR